jgi:NDP-mannose synthase
MPDHIVVLAGGQASRLAPYRTIVPKPLMPIGNRSVLDHMLRHAAAHGFSDVTLAVGDLAPLIRAMFGDGSRLGLRITYMSEPEPLGSAGVLRQLTLDKPFLVVGGNLLTTLDLRRFLEAHGRAGNAMTVATQRREIAADFGVLHLGDESDGETVPVMRYVEHARTAYTASMGVYAIRPDACEHIDTGEHLRLPQLAERLIAAGQNVGAYEHNGLCLDVRRREDYEQAIARYEEIAPFLAEADVREAA